MNSRGHGGHLSKENSYHLFSNHIQGALQVNRELLFVEETLRDGQLSLWATRMSTEDMLSIAATIDRAGFWKACVSSGAAFDTAVRFLHEDPWERNRQIRELMPNTPLQFLVRGRNLIGWRQYSDDVVELLIKCLARTGFDWIQVFDGLNDFSNIKCHVACTHRHGLRVSGAVMFTVSPVHTDEYFVGKVRELVSFGVDAITFYDASGVLTPERAKTLIPALRSCAGDRVTLELNVHGSTGLDVECYREGALLGADAVSTASNALAHGDSLPATTEMIEQGKELGFQIGLDQWCISRIDDYFHWVAFRHGHPVGERVTFDPIAYEEYSAHQIPGGMMSNFIRQLSDAGVVERLPEILDEVARVRAELGYPPMVTPYSQLIGVQATLNILGGERYKTVPRELSLYAIGHYGEVCAPIDQNVLDRVALDVRVRRPDFNEPDSALASLKTEFPNLSDEEILLRLFYDPQTMAKYEQNRMTVDIAVVAMSPLTELIKEILFRRHSRRLSISIEHVASREGHDGNLKLTYRDVQFAASSLDAAPDAVELQITHEGFHLSVAR
jgi:pyruvate/oxaloacetate carboxyltransferase